MIEQGTAALTPPIAPMPEPNKWTQATIWMVAFAFICLVLYNGGKATDMMVAIGAILAAAFANTQIHAAKTQAWEARRQADGALRSAKAAEGTLLQGEVQIGQMKRQNELLEKQIKLVDEQLEREQALRQKEIRHAYASDMLLFMLIDQKLSKLAEALAVVNIPEYTITFYNHNIDETALLAASIRPPHNASVRASLFRIPELQDCPFDAAPLRTYAENSKTDIAKIKILAEVYYKSQLDNKTDAAENKSVKE